MVDEARKPNLIVDFDDTIHDYQGRWIGTGQCAGGMLPGAREWLIATAQIFTIHICSTRSSQVAGVLAMKRCLTDDDDDQRSTVLSELIDRGDIQFPETKPASVASLDDRGLRFTGEYPSAEDILALRTWSQPPRPAGGDDPRLLAERSEQFHDAAQSYERIAQGPEFARHPDWAAALRDIARQVRLLERQIDAVMPVPEAPAEVEAMPEIS